MTDSLLEAEVAAFLDKYMEAFGAFDGKAIAACYHVPVITLRGDGSIHCLTSEDELTNFFQTVADTYAREGSGSESRRSNLRVIPLGGRSALATMDWEMLRADGLIVMQGSNCNEQIPAKLYEYFRARRPILGLADPLGDTGKVMRDAGVTHIAKLEDADQVESAIDSYLCAVCNGAPFAWKLSDMSRRARAGALAGVLEEACTTAGHTTPSKARCEPRC